MSLMDPLSSAAYGVIPVGIGYPTMSPIGQVGRMGRPALPALHPDNPMLAFGIILAVTMLGFAAASYTGSVRLGPFKVGGTASAGKR